MIVGLTGYARSGKDTVGKEFIARGFTRLSFADKLRELVLEINPVVHAGDTPIHLDDVVNAVGWEEAKELPDVRECLQIIGTACRNVIDHDVWVNALENEWWDRLDESAFCGGSENFVFTDVRFANEAAHVGHTLRGIVIEVVRPGVGPVNGHVSERRIPEEMIDYKIDNDGTIEDLKAKIAEIIEKEGR